MSKPAQSVTTYFPDSRNQYGFFKPYLIMLKNIISSRELIIHLFKRDFFAAYKKSFLGIGWVLISPLIGIASWVFMSLTGILNPGPAGVPYPVYVLLSSSIWGLFLGFYSAGESTLGAGASFILQVKYPHEALLIKQTAQHLANFLISFVINLLVFLSFGVMPSWCVIFFPIVALPLFLLGAGIGLMMSVLGVVSVEIQKAFNILLGLMIYITPVIYTSNVDNALLKKIISINPLTYLISAPRDIILNGRIENLTEYLAASCLSIVIFLISMRLFFVSEETVVEKMI